MKTKIIPFDLETAIEIQKGKIKGRIMCNNEEVNIINLDVDFQGEKRICAHTLCDDGKYHTNIYDTSGNIVDFSIGNRLYFELQYPDEPQFKPFDKVLVRDFDDNVWRISLYGGHGSNGFYGLHGLYYRQCIPYEGNEHLVGTTDKPKEE